MKIYAYIKTDETPPRYPLYEGDIAAESGSVGPEFVLPSKYAPVYYTELPVNENYNTHKIIHEPILVDGKWFVNWLIVPLSERDLRDRLCDEKLKELNYDYAAFHQWYFSNYPRPE